MCVCIACVGGCFCTHSWACLWLSACLFATPEGTLIVCLNVSQGEEFAGCAARGTWWRWWWWGQGNWGTFPVEMGLSLHQLLLQLEWGACRSLGTKPVGLQTGTSERALKKKMIGDTSHTQNHVNLVSENHTFALCSQMWRGIPWNKLRDHDMDPARRFPSPRGPSGTMDEAVASTWSCEPWKCFWGGRRHVKKLRKHTNMCSGICSHVHTCPDPKTHTHGTHGTHTTAKHTTHYIWTVSLTDQTHVDSLTSDLSMYDYSSSSSYWGLGYDTATHNTEPPLFTFQSNLYFQLFLHRVHRKEGIHTGHQNTNLAVRPLFIYLQFFNYDSILAG